MTDDLDSLRAELRQLRADHAAGRIDTAAYDAARSSLERELIDLVVDGDAAGAPAAPRRLVAGALAAIVAVTVAGYAITGAPEHLALGPGGATQEIVVDAGEGAEPVDEAQIAQIIERMAARLREQPDDPDGWSLLARAYAAMGRFSEAAPAFRKAVSLRGDDPDLLADFADTLAALHGGRFNNEVLGLIDRALAIDSGHPKALALAGSAAFDRRDYATAVAQWERVAAALPPGSPMLAQVRASIANAREAGGLPPGAVAAAPPAPPVQAPPRPEAVGMAVRGRVALAPSVAAHVRPEDTVYIVARAAEGPRMPLAVLRKQVKDLPADFVLDDSLAMTPAGRISQHSRVVVIARVSRSGDAMPQPGDPVGESPPVTPGGDAVRIEIGQPVVR
ncbi:MAG: c-type cytochrome biogenesis protein CcmI [Rubrivivax sp.]|jgi:cytochrome c-type biogenesis protein CcmH|nr:c-type cytochrome biogenesis protein CcmI [Rubrivivax sp.]